MMLSNIFLKTLLAAIILLTASSCQNDGHIGWIFGVWRVESFTIDGQPADSSRSRTTTFGFQNNIVEVVAPGDVVGNNTTQWGTWSMDGEEFTLDFTHSDDNNPAGTGIYAAPAWLGMTSSEPMRMTVAHRGDSFTMTWHSPEGTTNVYKLAKTW